MGGDGGTYVTGRQFIRACKTDLETEDASKSVKDKQRRRATHCAQSGLLLEEPVVMCQLGNLFNKEVILDALINKCLNSHFSHIRGLKDVKQVIFTNNPAFTSQDHELSLENPPATYVCPITRQDFNGCHPFVLIWTTGWLLSEKALREMGVGTLQTEYGPFSQEDIVTVLPLEDQLAASNHMMTLRYAKSTSRKKISKEEKKRKRAVVEEGVVEIKVEESGGSSSCSNSGSSVNTFIGRSSSSPSGSLEEIKLGSSGKLVKAASASIKAQTDSSTVFSTLFHKTDNKPNKSADDLLMRVGGIRGTLG